MKTLLVGLLSLNAMAQSEVTYAKDVAPILYQHCTVCHRAGEAAPFSLETYDDASKRARLIAGVTQQRAMPPWKAEPASHAYRDERRLSDGEIALLAEWAKQGAPSGDLSLAPKPPVFPAGWQLGQPDLVVEMPQGYRLAADGPNVYRNFALPLGLTQDQWIAAIEYRPSARSVVHHVLFSGDSTGAAVRADAADPEPGYRSMGLSRGASLGAWAVGTQPHRYPEGLSVKLAKGTDLVLQMHLVPNGQAQTEKSQVGLYFAKEPSRRTIVSAMMPPVWGALDRIAIPAGEANYRVRDEFTLPVDCEMIAVFGHAHYLGKELRLTAQQGNSMPETLLRISDWDFSWQDRYVFATPVRLAKGTKLEALVRWDNSAANPRNPAQPPVGVSWGEESTDEMGTVAFEMVAVDEKDTVTLQQALRLHTLLKVVRR